MTSVGEGRALPSEGNMYLCCCYVLKTSAGSESHLVRLGGKVCLSVSLLSPVALGVLLTGNVCLSVCSDIIAIGRVCTSEMCETPR